MDAKDLASLLVDFGWEQLDGAKDSEKDDFLLDAFQEALAGLLVSYKIMNPTVDENTLLDSVFEKLEDDFLSKFSAVETMRSDKYIN